MNYIKGVLSGLAAILLAEFVLAFKDVSEQKATGLGAIAGGFAASIFSPLLWIFVCLFFALLLAASRLGNKLLRISLFWVPTLLVCVLGSAVLALFTYVPGIIEAEVLRDIANFSPSHPGPRCDAHIRHPPHVSTKPLLPAARPAYTFRLCQTSRNIPPARSAGLS